MYFSHVDFTDQEESEKVARKRERIVLCFKCAYWSDSGAVQT